MAGADATVAPLGTEKKAGKGGSMQQSFVSFDMKKTNVDLAQVQGYSPVHDRRCRDLLFLLLFFAAQVGAVIVWKHADDNGDMNRLKYGISSLDQLCGTNETKDRPYLTYCSKNSMSVWRAVCVSECPASTVDVSAMWLTAGSTFASELDQAFSRDGGSGYGLQEALTGCAIGTKPVLNRCFIDYNSLNATDVAKWTGYNQADNGMQWATEQFNDLYNCWYVVCVTGIVVATFASFLVLYVTRKVAFALVWTGILGFHIAMIATTLYSASEAGMLGEHDPYNTGETSKTEQDREDWLTYLTYALIAVTVIVFLLVVFFRKRINLAIGIMQEASRVMASIPQMILIPLPVFAVAFMVTAAFSYTMSLLYSGGDIKDGSLQVDAEMRRLALYLLFWYFWVMCWLQGLCDTTMAGSVTSWYWTKDKGTVSWPVKSGAYRTLRYSMGSVAFGSLLEATIKSVRVVFNFYTRQLKWLKKYDNGLVKFVLWTGNCCLWCVEKVLKFLNRNAYIMVAIFGEAYCPSARNAFLTLAGNAFRFLALSIVSHFLIFLCTMGTVALSCFVCFLWITNDSTFNVDQNSAVSSPVLPVIVCGLMSYFVACNVFGVYEMTIETLFMCFAKDEEHNRKGGNYFASPTLQHYMSQSFRAKVKDKE